MKFKVTAYTPIPTRFGNIGEYRIQSLCGKYRKTIGSYDYHRNLEDGVVMYHNESALTRVSRRLNKIGIKVELLGSLPWVYLDKVNGIQVTEVKNSEHRYCITYNTDQRYLRFRKDLFRKIREILGENI